MSAQETNPAGIDTVRVTVSMNSDGSRTTYRFDRANHKATATTVDQAGRKIGSNLYTLDESGRFATGEIYGAKGEMRFKTLYTYNPAGSPADETQLGKDGAVQHRIVYAYDSAGKQTGYVIYDAEGRVISRTGMAAPPPAKTQKSRPSGH